MADAGEDIRRAVTVLDIGCVIERSDQQALRVGDDVTLPALDLLACVKAPMPAASRAISSKAWLIDFHTPIARKTGCPFRERGWFALQYPSGGSRLVDEVSDRS